MTAADIARIRHWVKAEKDAACSDMPTSMLGLAYLDVGLLLAEIDRLTELVQAYEGESSELEAIVRDLADLDEPIYDYIDCFLCGVIGDHAETCPWRRAVEWVDQPSRRRQR